MKRKVSLLNITLFCAAVVFAVYLVSIFVVNIKGEGLINYDIYSDMVLARYMALEGTLFPEGWYFGNQIYVVATPVLAAILYPLAGDAYDAMAAASCVMTVLTVLSFVWCISSFVKWKGVVVGLVVLIGGTNIGLSAHAELTGLQVFYTMASYYACYVIGIFMTLGIWFRLINGIPVKKIIRFGVILLNFALSMQSLRELLVLNLPQCALTVLYLLIYRKQDAADVQQKNAVKFTLLALAAGVCGLLASKLLITLGVISQNTILIEAQSGWQENIRHSFGVFLEYIGFVAPETVFHKFRIMGAAFSVVIVLAALVCMLREYCRTRSVPVSGYALAFFCISLMAVFAAGVLFIRLRPIYYFCWYSLVAVSAACLIEEEWTNFGGLLKSLKILLVLGLLFISIYNYRYTFMLSFRDAFEDGNDYQNIVAQLKADGIGYLYSDWRTDKYAIGAMANDGIIYGTLEFSGNPDDLWNPVDFLYSASWFDESNFDKAYILLSEATLDELKTVYSAEYTDTFMSNLELVHTFAGEEVLYFYKGSPKMYTDMIR